MRCRVVLCLCLVAGPAFCDAERYEVGRRLHELELAWDAAGTTAEAKKQASPLINDAVQSFFRLDLIGVGKGLDAARYALAATPPSEAQRWADAQWIDLDTRLVDSTEPVVTVTVRPYYKSGVEAPRGLTVRTRVGMEKEVVTPVEALPRVLKVPCKLADPEKSDDTRVTAEFVLEGKVLATKSAGLSRVSKLSDRLKAIKAAADTVPSPAKTIEEATLVQLAKQVTELANKSAPETDYPISRFVGGAEALIRTKGELYYTVKRPAEFWLAIPTAKAPCSIRVRVPAKLDKTKPVPTLVCLHGMGGSENLFFDGYGNGVFPRMASERGWLVLATRVNGLLGAGPAPDVPAVLDRLAERYPIDPKRVYVVGHSMGAGHAVQLALRNPDRYRAVAALGGGGQVAKADLLKELPFFVGCGTKDFALMGAKALHKALDGKAPVTFKEYPDIEHMMIVREAAEDVFKFFDAAK